MSDWYHTTGRRTHQAIERLVAHYTIEAGADCVALCGERLECVAMARPGQRRCKACLKMMHKRDVGSVDHLSHEPSG